MASSIDWHSCLADSADLVRRNRPLDCPGRILLCVATAVRRGDGEADAPPVTGYTHEGIMKTRLSRESLVMPIAVGLPLALGVTVGWRYGADVALAVLALLVLAVYVVLRPKAGVFIVLTWAVVQYWVVSDLSTLPGPAVWFDEYVLVVLVFAVAFRAVTQRALRLPRITGPPVLALVIVGLLSAMYNANFGLPTLLGLRGLLQYYVLVLALLNIDWTDRDTLRLARLGVLTLVAQTVAVGVQIVSVGNPLQVIAQQTPASFSAGGFGDLFTGTFGAGGANSLGFLCLLGVACALAATIVVSSARPWITVAVAAAVFPWLMSSSRTSYIVALSYAATVAFLFLAMRHRRSAEVLAGTAVSLAIVFNRALADAAGRILDVGISTQTRPYSARLLYGSLISQLLRGDAGNRLLGLGPGMFGSFTSGVLQTKYELLYRGYFDVSGSVVRRSLDSGILSLWAEFGAAGIAVLSWLIVRVVRCVLGSQGPEQPPMTRAIGLAALAALFVLTLGALTNNIWEIQGVASWCWILLGLLELASLGPSEEATR